MILRRPGRSAFALLLALTCSGLATAVNPAFALDRALAPGLPREATAPVVRIGFFANLTHAPALVAQEMALFEGLLGKQGTRVEYILFNAGPAVIEAMKGGAIDMAYVGPTPSVSGFATTGGTLLRVVSGAASGGAQLVVQPSIRSAADLKGKKIATPQLGNTQDVALRIWLKGKGLSTTTRGGGDVPIYPTANATTLALFRKGQIDGGWVPEPWASRLVLEGGGRVLVDEKTLWPGGAFVTTNIIAKQDFLARYPGTVRSVLEANNTAIDFIKRNPTKAKSLVQKQMQTWTGKPLSNQVLERAWSNLTFTWDPLAATLKKNALDAVSVGLLPPSASNVNGIYDLRLLNAVLVASRESPVDARNLGAD